MKCGSRASFMMAGMNVNNNLGARPYYSQSSFVSLALGAGRAWGCGAFSMILPGVLAPAHAGGVRASLRPATLEDEEPVQVGAPFGQDAKA